MSSVGDSVLCVKCGYDLTAIQTQPGRRPPCPNCGGLVRRIEGRVVAAGSAVVTGSAVVVGPAPSVGGTGVVTVPAPTATATVDALKPALTNTELFAMHFDHMVRTYPPTESGDIYVLELVNPDIGVVGIAAHEDRSEAFRQLTEDYADDT